MRSQLTWTLLVPVAAAAAASTVHSKESPGAPLLGEISEAWFASKQEFAADPPSNAAIAVPRRQLELHVTGTTARRHQHYRVVTSVFVRGALWRRFTASLCTSLLHPTEEIRKCDEGRGAYSAQLWVVVPRFALDAAGASLRALPTREGLLLAARAELLALDVCAPSFALPAMVRPKACDARAVSPVELMSSQGGLATHVLTNMNPKDWELMGALFVLAARSLPQPFSVMESGNLCGGATVFFALLKKVLCPACTFHSRDPGTSRKRFSKPMNCAEEAARIVGVASDVELANSIGAAVSVDLPVGFVFLDDGKARFANDPLMSYLHEHMMHGSIVLMDDAWQGEPMPHSNGHWGQVQYAHELVLSGDYTGLAFPEVDEGPSGLGFAKSRRWNGTIGSGYVGHAEPIARVRVSLADGEGNALHAAKWVDLPNTTSMRARKGETSSEYWHVVG